MNALTPGALEALQRPATALMSERPEAALLALHAELDAAAAHPDADLLAVCSEFRASEAALHAIYEENDSDDSDERCDASAAPIKARWDGMLDRMAQLRATTSEGLAARVLALAQHSGTKPGYKGYAFAFDPEDGTVTGRLLHMLLTDAVAMCREPVPGELTP